MKVKECVGCPYLSSHKKNFFCGYKKENKVKSSMRFTPLQNVKNISVCYLDKK